MADPPGAFDKPSTLLGKQPLTVFQCDPVVFIKCLRLGPMFGVLHRERIAAVEFESANPTVVKSIKQRDLLNTWLRLYARERAIPRIGEYEPSRLAEELPDLVY